MVVVMLLSVVERNYRLHKTRSHYIVHGRDFIFRRRKSKRTEPYLLSEYCVLCAATLMCVNAATIKIVNAVYSLMVKANIAMFFILRSSFSLANNWITQRFLQNTVIQVVNITSYDTNFVYFYYFIFVYEENMNLIAFIRVIFNLIIFWLFPLLENISLLVEFRRKKSGDSIYSHVCVRKK